MLPKAPKGSYAGTWANHDHWSFYFSWQVKIGCATKHKKGRVNIKCLRKINRDEILLLPAEETLDFIAFVHLRQVTGANAVMYGTLATCPLCGY